VQTDPRLGDLEGNLGRCLELLDEAAARDCELVVFPECAFSGYMLDSVDAVRAAAEPIPGATTQRLAAACARLSLHCVAGLLELDGARLRNTAVLVGPDGLVGGYRKSHIACIGADRFTMPGDDAYEVFETAVGRLGLQVSYAWHSPEYTSVLPLAAPLLVFNTTNTSV